MTGEGIRRKESECECEKRRDARKWVRKPCEAARCEQKRARERRQCRTSLIAHPELVGQKLLGLVDIALVLGQIVGEPGLQLGVLKCDLVGEQVELVQKEDKGGILEVLVSGGVVAAASGEKRGGMEREREKKVYARDERDV